MKTVTYEIAIGARDQCSNLVIFRANFLAWQIKVDNLYKTCGRK